jgi:hypothetical protein
MERPVTLLFIDTEFTSLQAPDLISVALVDESGREFYAERSDFAVEACTPFVLAEVLPLLGPVRSRKPFGAIQRELADWLEPYSSGQAVICCDDHRDWTLFCELLGDAVPSWVRVAWIASQLNEAVLADYFARSGVRRHHALDDAHGNRLAFAAVRPSSGAIIEN